MDHLQHQAFSLPKASEVNASSTYLRDGAEDLKMESRRVQRPSGASFDSIFDRVPHRLDWEWTVRQEILPPRVPPLLSRRSSLPALSPHEIAPKIEASSIRPDQASSASAVMTSQEPLGISQETSMRSHQPQSSISQQPQSMTIQQPPSLSAQQPPSMILQEPPAANSDKPLALGIDRHPSASSERQLIPSVANALPSELPCPHTIRRKSSQCDQCPETAFICGREVGKAVSMASAVVVSAAAGIVRGAIEELQHSSEKPAIIPPYSPIPYATQFVPLRGEYEEGTKLLCHCNEQQVAQGVVYVGGQPTITGRPLNFA